MKSEDWFVYVVVADDVRKIGISQDVKNRVTTLQTGNASNICLETVFAVGNEESARLIEKKCHDALKFAGAHVRGEWFFINCQLAKSIIRAAARENFRVIEKVFSLQKEIRRSKRYGTPIDVVGVVSFLRNNEKRVCANMPT